MALQVVSPAVSVYRITGRDAKTGAEQAEEHLFKRGELLPNWVSPFQQFTLTSTGMAREVGDVADPTLVKAEDVPAPVVLPEHNPSSVLGSGVNGPMVVTEAGAAPASDVVQPLESLPDDSETKPAWEDAAVALGLSRNKAESMRKGDLVAEVKARQAAAEEARDLGGADTELPPARA